MKTYLYALKAKLFSTRKRIIATILIVGVLVTSGGFGAAYYYRKAAADYVQPANYVVNAANPTWFNEYLLNKDIWNNYIRTAQNDPADNRHPDVNDCNTIGQLFWARAFESLYIGLGLGGTTTDTNAFIKSCWKPEHLNELYQVFWPEYKELRGQAYFTLPELDRLSKIKAHKDAVSRASGEAIPVDNPLEWFIVPGPQSMRLVGRAVDAVVDSALPAFVKVTFTDGANKLVLLTRPIGTTAQAAVNASRAVVRRLDKELTVVLKNSTKTVTRDTVIPIVTRAVPKTTAYIHEIKTFSTEYLSQPGALNALQAEVAPAGRIYLYRGVTQKWYQPRMTEEELNALYTRFMEAMRNPKLVPQEGTPEYTAFTQQFDPLFQDKMQFFSDDLVSAFGYATGKGAGAPQGELVRIMVDTNEAILVMKFNTLPTGYGQTFEIPRTWFLPPES